MRRYYPRVQEDSSARGGAADNRPRSHTHARLVAALAVALWACMAASASAGPPFLTDDPEPVDYRHWEFYTFSTVDRGPDTTTVQAPAAEVNYGFAPDFQAHAVFPFTFNVPRDPGTTFGYGDTELGLKYRFIHETDSIPQVGTFPMLELSTGSARRGLGNGTTWTRLPIWAQKSWGDWTSYGGGGYAFNSAPGQEDYPFGGILLQKKINDKWTLGGEVFAQGKTAVGGEGSAILDVGGYYSITKDFQVLFAVGHSVAGEDHLVGYAGLYWTW
jgi:hypothetical protein